MVAAWVVRGFNVALGLGYLAWLAAATALGRRVRRRVRRGRGDSGGPRRWIGRLCRIGAAVGAAALAVGLVGTVMKDPPGRMDRMVWPGVVYLGTAILMAIRLRRLPGGAETPVNEETTATEPRP